MNQTNQAIIEPRVNRQRALERQVERLQRCLDVLQARNKRFSWYRLGVFLTGIVAVGVALVYFDRAATWIVLILALAAFAIIVFFHRRLDSQIARFAILQSITAGKLARMRLDWEHIPYSPHSRAQTERNSLAIDLDLTGVQSLHHLVDLAVSQEGSQLLAAWLSQPDPDVSKIAERQAVVGELATIPGFIDRLLLNYLLVSGEQLSGERLLAWLSIVVPARRLKWSLIAGSALAAANLALFILNITGRMPAYWTFTVVLTLGFYLFTSSGVGEFLSAVVAFDGELDRFRALLDYLERYPYRNRQNLASLAAPFTDPQNLPSVQIRRVKTVTAAVGLRSNPLLGLLLNAVLPWDYTFAWLASRMQVGMSQVLPNWLQTWYQLEGLCSLANFAYLNPEYTLPQVAPAMELSAATEPIFRAEAMGHPLIPAERKVCNDFSVPGLGEVIVITGSNMAGKSTFIKTMGINLCLAYAGGPVNAANLRTLSFRLHTCIHISDSIADGFSYFYAEVKCLRALLDGLAEGDSAPLLYLIDEIFRGTNNRERLIGSQAYVNTLIGARGVGLIATHDLELANLEESSSLVRNFHFRDHVQDGRLAFDYKITPGPCPTTNALKIMEMEGLPVGV